MHKLAQLDHRYLWHPFTQMKEWLETEPIVIVSGKGSLLRNVKGKPYLDANASIWTNLHGHNHPRINAAVRAQLRKIAHSSALGLANEPASLLAAELVREANRKALRPELAKVFFSDDGSTGMEVALKLAYEYARRTRGLRRPRFLTLAGAYHGDTIGAVSLGHIDLFHKNFAGLLFRSDSVMAPYCYRCRFNRAKPERIDARLSRRCQWECVREVEQKFLTAKKRGRFYAAMAVEPLLQGAGGFIAQPAGWLSSVAELVRSAGAQLICDEVMTGFGRLGARETNFKKAKAASWFASHQEQVQPDFLVLAKGLTGGYLPMAATLTTQAVFDAFLGDYAEFKTFFHGHSYTANQLGAAAALANIELLRTADSFKSRWRLQKQLESGLAALWKYPVVGDIRQVGLAAGIELVKDWRTRRPFDLSERAGIRVCEAMARRGVLTRPIGNVLMLMPPYSTTERQLAKMFGALEAGLDEVFGT